MSEHERTIEIGVSPKETFRFLSSVSSLPSFLPWIRSIRQDPHGEQVFGMAEFEGNRWEINGFYRVSNSTRRIDWGSDGTPDYQGWLEVRPGTDEKSCRLTVHIAMRSAASEQPPKHAGFASEHIETMIDRVMNSIKTQLEKQHAGELVGQGPGR